MVTPAAAPTHPAVSVCIPVHQGGRFLAHTLDRALAQVGVDFEVVVSDNASTDATVDILRARADDARLRVHRSSRLLSLQENWRRAVELSRGRLIKLLCADDLITPDALRLQAQLLDEHSGVTLVASRRDLIDADSRVLSRSRGLPGLLGRRSRIEVLRRALQLGINPIGEPGGVMFRRVDHDAVGGFALHRGFVLDLDLWMRLLERGDLLGQPEVLAAFRLSIHGLSDAHTADQFSEHAAYLAEEAALQRPAVNGAARYGRVTLPVTWRAWALRRQLFGLRSRLRSRMRSRLDQ